MPAAVAVSERIEQADRETEQLIDQARVNGNVNPDVVNTLGEPLNRRSPFYLGLMAGLGLLVSYGLVHMLLELTQLLTFILVALFVALGLEPLVSRLVHRGLRRGWAVLVVMLALLALLIFIGWMIVPTFAQEVGTLVDKTPGTSPTYSTTVSSSGSTAVSTSWSEPRTVRPPASPRVPSRRCWAGCWGRGGRWSTVSSPWSRCWC